MLNSLIDKTKHNERVIENHQNKNSDYAKKITALWGSITDETFIRHSELMNNAR